MSGAVDPARAMADTINKKLEETSLIAPSSKIYRGITLSGFVTAGVDDLGNLTLTSSVGHIEVSGALKEVLGIPTQRSQKRQVVEDLLVMNADRAKNNASILFEVTSAANGAVTVKATSNVLTTDGRMENYVRDNIVLFTGDGVANAVKLGGLLGEDDEDFTLALDEGVISSFFDIGSKFVCNVTGAGIDDRTANMSVTVEATQDPDWPDRWEENWTDNGGNVKGAPVSERLTYNLNAEAAANKDLPFRNFYVNSDNGTVYEGNVVVTTNDNFTLDETRYQPTMMTTKIGVRNSSEITGSEAFKIKVGDSEFTYNTAWGWEGSDWRKNDSHNDLFAQHLYAALQAAIEDGSLKNVSISMSGQTLMIESPFGEEITIDTTGSPHYTSSVTSVPANPPFTFTGNIHDSDRLAGFTAAYVGKIGTDEVRLRDLSAFWDSQGNFLLDDPQTLTITQGDGKTARVTLYANDTLEETRARLNNAIANGLGQAKYDPGRDDNFCSFVEKTPGVPMPSNGLESVAGTFVFRSLIPGAAGELSFSGSEEILNALGLNTIQEATENQFTVSVRDAHTGRAVMSGVKVTGNLLIDIPTDNVDTEIDIMAGITAEWDDAQKRFTYTTKAYSTTLHLSDNTTVFQVGANEGEDLAIHIGDMSAHALGLDRVDVSTRDRATRSITVIDSAIDRVSTQRARLGAYQNRLEHTISNLTTEDENLTAAESRIRDADMAREMMHFSRLQIILQAGNSMLAQANQLPQNVLSLVR
ncbi:MAG: hypothetical protein K5841_02325 [Fretibacterium sp.]|nr:hypothetical protein [Fretibacterium sp.]